MTQETAYTTDLLRRFADVAPSLNAKAILLVCETTAAAIHSRVPVFARPSPVDQRPPSWEKVEVCGHTSHVGLVTEVEELGARCLRVDVPAYVDHGWRYAARTILLSAIAIFRRTALSEAEAQRLLHYQTIFGEGEPLPGLLVAQARARIGGYRFRPALAAKLLGMPESVYAAIEDCSTDITEERARELIADLAAAWAARELTAPWRDEGGEHPAEEDEDAAEGRAHGHPNDTSLGDEDESDEPPAAKAVVKLLDFSQPPPGYHVGAGGWRNGAREEWHYITDAGALAHAWLDYKEHNDPPAMLVGNDMGWAFSFRVDNRPRPLAFGHYDTREQARAAAWVRYGERLALWRKLAQVEVVMRTFVVDDLWPRILTWTDEQAAEVERWLVDSTAEMPEVLGG